MFYRHILVLGLLKQVLGCEFGCLQSYANMIAPLRQMLAHGADTVNGYRYTLCDPHQQCRSADAGAC